jgi:hypothetical protein
MNGFATGSQLIEIIAGAESAISRRISDFAESLVFNGLTLVSFRSVFGCALSNQSVAGETFIPI